MNTGKNGSRNGRMSHAAKANAASLDQVREILFGDQARDVSQRLSQLEKRLEKQLSAVQADITKRFAAAEKANAARVDALREALENEVEARSDGSKQLSVDLRRSMSDLAAKLKDADRGLRASLSDLDRQLGKNRQALSAEIRSLATTSTQALSAATADLQDQKANREDLAVMFAEFAERLSTGRRKKKG